MIPAFTYGLAGLKAARTSFAARSQNIVNAYTPGYQAAEPIQTATPNGPIVTVNQPPANQVTGTQPQAPLDLLGNNVNLPEEVVGSKLAEISYKASLAVLKTASEIEEETLDLLA